MADLNVCKFKHTALNENFLKSSDQRFEKRIDHSPYQQHVHYLPLSLQCKMEMFA